MGTDQLSFYQKQTDQLSPEGRARDAIEETVNVQSPSDEKQSFTLFQSKINIPSKATYLKVSFAHYVPANSNGGNSERRNVDAKFNLFISDQIIAKKDLKTEWSQPVGKYKESVYADYSNLVVPIKNISGLV